MKSIVAITENSNSITVKYRIDNDIKFETIPFNNYFFIDLNDIDKVKEILKNFDVKYQWYGGFIKIILKNNYDRLDILKLLNMNGVLSYEADLDSSKRYIVDNELDINPYGYKWIFYDIETMDTRPFEKDNNDNIIATTPVLSIAYIDIYGNKFYIKNNNLKNPILGEKDLLKKHLEIIQKYDIVSGWNSWKFDDVYIKQRCDYHYLDVDKVYKFINFIDYMELVKTYYKLEEYKLDYVAEHLLGYKKVDIGEKGHGNIYELWKKSFEQKEEDFDELIEKYNTDNEIVSLKSYNFKDVWLLYKLEEKYELFNNLYAVSDIVKAPPKYVMDNSSIADILLLRKLNKKGIRCITKKTIDLSGEIYVYRIDLDDINQPYHFIYKTE